MSDHNQPVAEWDSHWDAKRADSLRDLADIVESRPLGAGEREGLAETLRQEADERDPEKTVGKWWPDEMPGDWPEPPRNSAYNQESDYEPPGFCRWLWRELFG